MENIVFSNILEGSSLIADKGTDNEYMKVYVIEANKDTFTKTTMNTIDGEKKFNEAGKLGGYALFILGYEEEFNPSGALSYFNKVFAAVDTFILSDGSSYTGPVGVIFATTLDKVGDYDRTEYGVILSEEELTVDEFKTDKKAVWAKGLKINNKNQYGIRFYGNKIKAGKTYYTLPYAKYENTKGDKVIVYGTKVIEFTPSDN